MKKQQLHAMQKMFRDYEAVHAGTDTSSVYAFEDGKMKVIESNYKEANRRLNSDDFKLGWKTCYNEMRQMILFIMTASDIDLVRYAGKPKNKKK